jgi:asparagine synthetase B (glutamine-hydrolysing)
MKYILRKAFEGEISEELLWRPKKTFQVGCHTDYLKNEQNKIDDMFEKLFIKKKIGYNYIHRSFGHNNARIKIEKI